ESEGASLVGERGPHRDERGHALSIDHLALGIDEAVAPIARDAELPEVHVIALLDRQRLDRRGVDPRDAAGHLGHSSFTTTSGMDRVFHTEAPRTKGPKTGTTAG